MHGVSTKVSLLRTVVVVRRDPVLLCRCCNCLVHYRWTEYVHSYSIYLSIIIPVIVVRYHCHQQVEQGRCQPLDLGHDTGPFDVLHVRDGHVPEQGGSRHVHLPGWKTANT